MPRKATGGKIGRPKKTVLTDVQKLALIADVVRTKQVDLDSSKGGSEIAREIGVTRAALSKWRSKPWYQELYAKLVGTLWAHRLDQRWDNPDDKGYYIDPDFKIAELPPETREQLNEKGLRKKAYEYLTRDKEKYELCITEYVKKNWVGPFKDEINDQQFQTADQYIAFLADQFLSDQMLVPAKLLKDTMAMLKRDRRA